MGREESRRIGGAFGGFCVVGDMGYIWDNDVSVYS